MWDDDDRIDPEQERGDHIVVRCKCGSKARWHTKNLGYRIGARSLFHIQGSGVECACPVAHLEVDPENRRQTT